MLKPTDTKEKEDIIRKLIKDLREENKYSQAELGYFAGIKSQSTFNHKEKGKSSILLSEFLNLMEILEVDITLEYITKKRDTEGKEVRLHEKINL